MTLRALLLLTLAACPASNGEDPPPGPSGPTNMAEPKSCNPADFTGILMPSGAAIDATEVGKACSKDYECWLQQTCANNTCTAMNSDEKLQSEVTTSAAGNYMVSIYMPADTPAELAGGGPIEITFNEFASRDIRVWRHVHQGAFHGATYALTKARTLAEPTLRAEGAAILRAYPGGIPYTERASGPSRQATCADTEFSFRDQCVAVGALLPQPIKIRTGPINAPVYTDISVRVQAIDGDTAILWDMANTSTPANIAEVTTAFKTIIGPRDRHFFNRGQAHTGRLDFDGNGKMAIVFSDKVGEGPVRLPGFFEPKDMVPATDTVNGNGNGMDLLWLPPIGKTFQPRGSSSNITVNLAYALGTLAHEYQHVINHARSQEQTPAKVETLSLNEGLSHLAEDLSGYGNSNISIVATALDSPERAGLFANIEGVDADDNVMRGLFYLYLRWAFEQAGGSTTNASGAIADGGGIAMLEKFYTTRRTGTEALAEVVGSSYCNFPQFFAALGISNNSDNAPAQQADARFNFKPTTTDPLTMQKVGISVNDSSRTDAFGNPGNIRGYGPDLCDTPQHAAAGNCQLFASGGVTFLWEDAPAGALVSIKARGGNNVRLSLVKVN